METHEKIKQLRLLRGLSQERLAQLAGYSDRSSIAKIEAGKVDLSQSKIAALASALGVSPGELMQITDPPSALSPDEHRLLDYYRSLNSDGKALVLQVAQAATFTHSEKNSAASNMETA